MIQKIIYFTKSHNPNRHAQERVAMLKKVNHSDWQWAFRSDDDDTPSSLRKYSNLQLYSFF